MQCAHLPVRDDDDDDAGTTFLLRCHEGEENRYGNLYFGNVE